MVMKYRTISGCVTVSGPPASICALNFGTTDPFEASTLPKRTAIRRMGRSCPALRRANSLSSAWQYISAKRFEAPSTDTGSIALSVEIITMAAAPAAAAASATLTEPKTLVLTPSSQSCSRSGTCLSAAAWNTMLGRKVFIRRNMRARSRTSARRPSIFARDCLAASASSTACRAGSEFSITRTRLAPKVTMRSQISAPIEPPPPVTMIDLSRTNASRRR